MDKSDDSWSIPRAMLSGQRVKGLGAGSERDRLPAGRDGSFGQGLLGGGAASPGEPAHLVVLAGCWGEGVHGEL